MTKRNLIALLVAAVVSLPAFAQRTAPGQWGASASYPVYPGQGLTLGALRYTDLGYWDVCLGAAYWGEYTSGASSLDNSNVGQWAALGGYMFRLVASRDRAFSAYAGADGFLGYEKIQRWYAAGHVGDEVENVSALGFGFLPRVELELFLTEKFALTADGGLELNVVSPKKVVRPLAGLGVRFCF